MKFVNFSEIPATFLQEIFYSRNRPHYMNYGSMGFIIGHEITHGFDDTGRFYDKEGNLFDWWTPESSDEFIKRTRCMIEQYENYPVKEVGLIVSQ